MGSPAGSISGSSSGWEQIDVGDVTDAAREVASVTDNQADLQLLDQVATPHLEQTTSSDDGFLLVASQSSSPHEGAQASASPLEDTASKTPSTVPKESLLVSSSHSIDQDMTGAAATTAGAAEISLKSSVLLADQQVAASSKGDAAAATSALEHAHVPTPIPVRGTKRAAPQAALRPLRTRYKPFTVSSSRDSSSLHQGSSDDLFSISPTDSRPVFSRSFGKSFGALTAEVASSQQPLPDLCGTLAGHAALPHQTAPQSPLGTAAYSPEGTAPWDLCAGTASAAFSPLQRFSPLPTRWQQQQHHQSWQQQQQQSQQEQESRIPVYQQLSGSGLMQLQQGQTLGGQPQQHLFNANPNSPRLHDYTQAQLWDHIQKMPCPPFTSPSEVAFQQQRHQAELPGVISPNMQQQQGGPPTGYTQQDCSRDFQQWEPFLREHSQPQQQGVQAKGTEQGKTAAGNADAAQACMGQEFQRWDPFLTHPPSQQQQQQQQGELPSSCTPEQTDLQSLQEQNASLRSQQWQLQQECDALKQREGQWRSYPGGPVPWQQELSSKQAACSAKQQAQRAQQHEQRGTEAQACARRQAHQQYARGLASQPAPDLGLRDRQTHTQTKQLQHNLESWQQQELDRVNLQADSLAEQQVQKHERYASSVASLQTCVVEFEPEQQDQYSMLVEDANRLRAQRLGQYARHKAALQGHGLVDIARAAATEREQALQNRAALQGPGLVNTGRAAEAEEEEALQAAMEASAKEYREHNNLLMDEEIVLPIHEGDRVVDGMRRKTAESLPIRHDTRVVWQNEEPMSNSIPAGSNSLGTTACAEGTTASAEAASDMVRPTVWRGSGRVGKLRSAETLHRFATRHMCDLKGTAAINGLQLQPAAGDANAPVLYPGQILQLPECDSMLEVGEAARLGALVARVESGCIEQFAKQWGVQLNSLLAVNGLPLGTSPIVRCGQVLQLP